LFLISLFISCICTDNLLMFCSISINLDFASSNSYSLNRLFKSIMIDSKDVLIEINPCLDLSLCKLSSSSVCFLKDDYSLINSSYLNVSIFDCNISLRLLISCRCIFYSHSFANWVSKWLSVTRFPKDVFISSTTVESALFINNISKSELFILRLRALLTDCFVAFKFSCSVNSVCLTYISKLLFNFSRSILDA